MNATYHYLNDWGKLVEDIAACLGTGPCNTGVEDTQTLLENGAGQLLSSYVQAGINHLNYVHQGAPTGLASLGVSLFNQVSGNSAEQTNQDIAAHMPSLLNGGIFISGAVQDASSHSGLDLIRVGTTLCANDPVPINSMTDATGSYVLAVPANPYCTTDVSLTLQASDPITGTSYGSEVVNLSGVNATQQISAPSISYVGPPAGTTPTPNPSPNPTPEPTPEPTPTPTPTGACCACAFDVYCTAFGPGGCWRCSNSTMTGGVCQAPFGSLTSVGACVCDAGLYQVCQ
jgi:hypothetical protein